MTKGTSCEEKHASVKKKFLWTFVFIAIAALTIYAITSQNKDFSFKTFVSFLSGVKSGWLILAVVGMLGFIFFEAWALLVICKAFGHKQRLSKGLSYAYGDIYFSAITPSASGGQPASAFFMLKDGIPSSVVTVALIINLLMYGVAILVVGLISFVMSPMVFFNFSILSKILIIAGAVVLILLSVLFIILLKKDALLHSICDKILCLLAKIHLIRKLDKKRAKLARWIDSYRECAAALHGKHKMLLKVLALNVLQRLSLISVTVFAYLACGGTASQVVNVLVIQSMVTLGSNCIPIPGAMGVADYLLLDGLDGIVGSSVAVNLELLARTVSFYLCVILCGLAMFGRILFDKFRKKSDLLEP